MKNTLMKQWLTSKLITLLSAAAVLAFIIVEASADTASRMQAVRSLEQKYKQDPKRWKSEMSTALFQLATDLFRDKKYAEAKAAYLKSNEIDMKGVNGKTSSMALAGAGYCCVELKQWTEAETLLGQAQVIKESSDMGNEAILLALGKVYENTNRIKLAERNFRKVAEDVSKREAGMPRPISSPGAFDALAQFLESQGKTKEAEEWYLRVTKLHPNAHAYGQQIECLRHYSALLKKQKRGSEAATLERQANELAKTQNQLNKSGADY